jgi:hypothetical protein
MSPTVAGPEWIGGDRRWKLLMLGQCATFVIATLVFLGFWAEWGGPAIFLGFIRGLTPLLLISAALNVIWFASGPASTRRIGFAVSGITFDFGLVRRTLPWGQVRVSGPQRLEAWFPHGRMDVRLSTTQEASVFRFLGIRPSPPLL